MQFLLRGIMAIGGVAVVIGIDKWSNLFQSYIDNLYPNLSDYILVSLIVSVVLIGIYYYKTKDSEKIGLVREDPYNRKEHLNTLNGIYKQLSITRLHEARTHSLVIQVVHNYDDWIENRSLAVKAGVYDKNYIQWTIPQSINRDLQRALIHLNQNSKYKHVTELWTKLNDLVDEYNEQIPSFVDFLENHMRTTISKKTNYDEVKNNGYGYYVSAFTYAIMYLLPFQMEGTQLEGLFDLQKSQVEGLWIRFIVHDSDCTLIYLDNGNADEIRDEVGKLLLHITKDDDVLNAYKPHYENYQKVAKCKKEFTDGIKPLIEDIQKNGYVVEGKCELGY